MIITRLTDEKKYIENDSFVIKETLLSMRRDLEEDLKEIKKVKW